MIPIKGITIKLWIPDPHIQPDPFGHLDPLSDGEWENISNVLVAPLSDTEILETVNLYGRKAVYQLGIPKGDTHNWKDGLMVQFFGEYWRIVGHPTEGISDLIPLGWNKKVKVESLNGAEITV